MLARAAAFAQGERPLANHGFAWTMVRPDRRPAATPPRLPKPPPPASLASGEWLDEDNRNAEGDALPGRYANLSYEAIVKRVGQRPVYWQRSSRGNPGRRPLPTVASFTDMQRTR